MKTMTPQMTALLEKIRKGATASVSIKQLISALEFLGGWKAEKFVGLIKMYGHLSSPESKEILGEENEGFARNKYNEIKAAEVSELPATPVAGTKYYMEVEDFRSWTPLRSSKAPYFGTEYKVWQAEEGYRFTAPNGKVFELVQSRWGNNSVFGLKYLRIYEVMPWLVSNTDLIKQVSDALGMKTPDEEKADKKPRTRDNTGTCSCCFANHKLRLLAGKTVPQMVLHGYQRPGWGYVVGQCFGLKYPPFELSCEGTKALQLHLEGRVVAETEYLRKLKAGEITTLSAYSSHNAPLKAGDFGWDRRVESEVHSTERTIKSLKADIETLTKLIADWKPTPLPKEGEVPFTWK